MAVAIPDRESEQQSSAQHRQVWTMFVMCCCCSSLLLLPICSGGIWNSFGRAPYSPAVRAQDDVAGEPSLSTSVWKTTSDGSPRIAAMPPATTVWSRLPEGEKYMWYAPHSGFGNQARELTNALKIAFLLNRTLVLPAVLDHFELEQGTCLLPLRNQSDLRELSWGAIIRRFDPSATRAYVSIADIIDLSWIKSTVKTIDLRVFLALWCGIDVSRTCSGPVCHTLARELRLTTPRDPFRAAQPNSSPLMRATMVWTNGESLSEKLHLEERLRRQLHSDPTLPSSINASSISIQRKDVVETLGPSTPAGQSFLLAFGTLFSRHYKDRTLMVDIAASRGGKRMAPILTAMEQQKFSLDIMDAGRYFVQKKIVGPFFCAHVRLTDGAFQFDQEGNVFRPLLQRLQQLETLSNHTTSGPLNLLLMTDLPQEKWQGTPLHDLHVDPKYKIVTMDGEEDLLKDVIQNIFSHERGLLSGYLPQLKYLRKSGVKVEEKILLTRTNVEEERTKMHFSARLFVEEVVCSCATLGFQGTMASTISRNIFNLREAQICPI